MTCQQTAHASASERVLGIGVPVRHPAERSLELPTVTAARPRREVVLGGPRGELLAGGTGDELIDGKRAFDA